jgi:hypothetical protein
MLDQIARMPQFEKDILLTEIRKEIVESREFMVLQLCERLDKTEHRLEPFHRGPKSRANQSQRRKDLIRQFLSAGMKDLETIQAALLQEAPDLPVITDKTLRNLISEL